MWLFIFLIYSVFILRYFNKNNIKFKHYVLTQLFLLFIFFVTVLFAFFHNIDYGINESSLKKARKMLIHQISPVEKTSNYIDYLDADKHFDFRIWGRYSREGLGSLAYLVGKDSFYYKNHKILIPWTKNIFYSPKNQQVKDCIYSNRDIKFFVFFFALMLFIAVLFFNVFCNQNIGNLKKFIAFSFTCFFAIMTLIILNSRLSNSIFYINKTSDTQLIVNKNTLKKYYLKYQHQKIPNNYLQLNADTTVIHNSYFEQKYVQKKLSLYSYLFYINDGMNFGKFNSLMKFRKLSNNFYHGYYPEYIKLQKKRNLFIESLILLFFGFVMLNCYLAIKKYIVTFISSALCIYSEYILK